MSPGIYSIKIFSEVVFTMADYERTIQIEYDEIRKETKLVLTRFGGTFGTLRFDEKKFFITLLGFTPYWVYKLTNAIYAVSSCVYTSEKFLKLSTIDNIYLKCDVIDGCVKYRVKEPKPYTFVSDKLPGFKIFCQPETFIIKN